MQTKSKCPICTFPVSRQDATCPRCGARLEASRSTPWWLAAAASLAVLAAALVIYYVASRASSPPEIVSFPSSLDDSVKERILEIDRSNDVLLVKWRISVLSEGLAAASVRMDVVRMLRCIAESGEASATVILLGYYNDSKVINLTYQSDTIKRIDWNTFDANRVYTVAVEATGIDQLK